MTEQTSYDSFGNATTNLSTRYQFTGREYDSFTGLQYSRARWYDAKTGRFISEDPIGFGGGDVNLYGYVDGNPLSFRDSLGLFPENEVNRIVIQTTRYADLLDEVIANTGSEAARNARLLAEIIENSDSQVKTAAAGGAGSLLAYGGTSVSAAGAAPVAATIGAGLAIGGAIGLPIGIYTSELPGNPVVNGSLNPFGKSAAEVANEPWIPQNSAPNCEIHGNSLDSPRPTWGYQLYSQDGTFLKNGITSKADPERRYTKNFMRDKYMKSNQFPNRRDAYDWEYQQNLTNRGPLNKNMH